MEYGIFQEYSKIEFYMLNLVFYLNYEYGIFQKKGKTIKIWKILEYGIFQEYSKKIGKQSKYRKFWNMEYSMEYSWNIPKNVKQASGA